MNKGIADNKYYEAKTSQISYFCWGCTIDLIQHKGVLMTVFFSFIFFVLTNHIFLVTVEIQRVTIPK